MFRQELCLRDRVLSLSSQIRIGSTRRPLHENERAHRDCPRASNNLWKMSPFFICAVQTASFALKGLFAHVESGVE